MEISKDASLQVVRAMNLPPLSALVRKENGVVVKEDCYVFIKGMIILMNNYFGVHWPDDQILEIAKEFYSQYYYWSMADWKLFSKKVKAMEYVDKQKGMMGFFSPDKLMFWASLYDNNWTETSQRITEGNHNTITREEKLCSREDRMKAEDDAKKFNEIRVDAARNWYRANEDANAKE